MRIIVSVLLDASRGGGSPEADKIFPSDRHSGSSVDPVFRRSCSHLRRMNNDDPSAFHHPWLRNLRSRMIHRYFSYFIIPSFRCQGIEFAG
ncbi:MAG: hypothetical protein D6795_05680 [Deltaproteobacteria bacterium]|nr:MAG: hypothetical protein D6795_05680 [Deltaproteobacteria bacterium]